MALQRTSSGVAKRDWEPFRWGPFAVLFGGAAPLSARTHGRVVRGVPAIVIGGVATIFIEH